jgi:TP53 regulating kinase-like protein
MNFLSRGAEAILYRKGDLLVKKRIPKGYRIKILDEKLRRERTNREAKLLMEAKRNGINVPSVMEKNLEETKIVMEYIDGEKLRNMLDNMNEKELDDTCKQIGEMITKLHEAGIFHGDLTTSNMILKDGKVYLIDFGLGRFSNKIEDFATDLHLLKHALIAGHNEKGEKIFEEIISYYHPKEKEKILKRLEEIEKRGRYSKRD